MQPQVRDLQSLIGELQGSIAPQQALIDADIIANADAGNAQEQGLAAKQTKAFGQIEQNAQNKGMFFSGFAPDAQASYTADTYLPALAQLQATIAGTRSQLLGKKADLNTGVFDKAYQTRENDLQVLAAWNKMTAEQQFQASEAEKQRAFTAQQNEQDRAAAARTAAANRSASAPKNNSGLISSIGSFLEGKKGGDGKVSPNTFQQGRTQWVAAGGDPDVYNQAFFGYVNTGQKSKYL